MKARINPYAAAPNAIKTVMAMENYVKESGLEMPLIELVKMRASQINGCAFCLNMHSHDARAAGETEQRLHVLPAWRETTLYTPRERAALAWTEALTLISETHAPDDVYEEARAQFNDKELTDLTLLVGAINVWNRIAIGFRMTFPATRAAA
jgi:AhpD family alkylhydroperoxidase